jgi:hypothetical protein
MWAALTKFDAESKNAVLSLASTEMIFGHVMTELVEATSQSFCCGVKVKKRRGHSGRVYEVSFDPDAQSSNSIAQFLPNIRSNKPSGVIVNDAEPDFCRVVTH